MPTFSNRSDPDDQAPQAPRLQQAPAAPAKLTPNQEKIFAAVKENEVLQKVLTCIFRDYPSIIIQTFKFGSPHATQAQKTQLKELNKVKLKMETYIEEVVAEFSGVELD